MRACKYPKDQLAGTEHLLWPRTPGKITSVQALKANPLKETKGDCGGEQIEHPTERNVVATSCLMRTVSNAYTMKSCYCEP
jgi:hypothetical protein